MKMRARRSHGFTLLEVTVALALIGLIAVALTTSLQFGRRSYEKVLRVDAGTWDVFSTQRVVRQLLEAAYPLDDAAKLAFTGDAQALEWLAPEPGGASAGLFRYRLALRPRGEALDLVLSSRPELQRVEPSALTEEVLLQRIAGIEWSYCCSGQEPAANQWQSSWSQRSLPSQVRVRVRFPAGDARSWPDLLAMPRVSEDANCVFDVVAQRCRSSS